MDGIMPLIIGLIIAAGLASRTEVFDCFLTGAGEGLKTALRIFPSVLAMLIAINMLRASGAIDLLINLLRPVTDFLGIPAACAPLVFLKPVSGGGALAIGAEIMAAEGVDSIAGRTAAGMLASADTTFFVITMYFGALQIKKTRHALPAALTADFTAFVVASLAVRLFFG